MALFKCEKYPSLGFYVDGRLHEFVGGEFTTEDEKVLKVLERLADVRRVDEPKPEPAEKVEEKAEKPAPKKAAKGGKKAAK
jgi:hypothetical protein